MEPPIEPDDTHSHYSPSSLQELPLFPLDLVLFPGMKVHLHISEEPHKDIVHRCLDESRLFGIVLVSPDQPANRDVRKTRTYRVGCSARIVHVERLMESQMNIEIEGVERFQILEQHEVESYRTGIVEPVIDAPMSDVKKEVAEELCTDVQRLLREFLTRQLALVGQRIVEFDLPDDLCILSYITGCVLPIENDDKQTLLETSDTASRLKTELDVLRRAITRLRRAAAAGKGAEENETGKSEEDTDSEPSPQAFEPIQADRYRDYLCVN